AGASLLSIPHLSARVAGVTVTARGTVSLPRRRAARPATEAIAEFLDRHFVAVCRQAIAWEDEYRRQVAHPESRPLNIDPGYLTEAKLVLASTKDRDHRIYLSQGIFAEVTLHFQQAKWQTRPWTYPDYQRADYHEFFSRCRDFLRQSYRDSARGQASGQE
ncbi:MAG: DUF4416 family protein, partial [Pirellulaceae bacterium]